MVHEQGVMKDNDRDKDILQPTIQEQPNTLPEPIIQNNVMENERTVLNVSDNALGDSMMCNPTENDIKSP